MATLQTGSTGLRTLPQLRGINLSDFQSAIPGMQAAERGVYDNARSAVAMRGAQRANAIEEATQADRLALTELLGEEALTLQPQQAELRALEAEEAVGEFGARSNARRSATTLENAKAIEGVEASGIRRDVSRALAPMAAETAVAERDAAAARTAAAKAQAGRTQLLAENAQQTTIVQDPLTGALMEDTFVVTEDETGSPVRRTISARQLKTPEQLAAEARQRDAQIAATEALTAQRLQPRTTTRPGLRPIMGGPLGNTTMGFVMTAFNPATGAWETTQLDASGNEVGPSQPAATGAAPSAAQALGLTPPVTGAPVAPVAAQAPAAQSGYIPNRVYAGMRFLGGDPNDAASWQRVTPTP